MVNIGNAERFVVTGNIRGTIRDEHRQANVDTVADQDHAGRVRCRGECILRQRDTGTGHALRLYAVTDVKHSHW